MLNCARQRGFISRCYKVIMSTNSPKKVDLINKVVSPIYKPGLEELLKLIRLRVLEAIPMLTPILTETWGFTLNHHIYEADALQITTCLHSQSNALISSDKKLVETSNKAGLNTFHVTKDKEKLEDFIK